MNKAKKLKTKFLGLVILSIMLVAIACRPAFLSKKSAPTESDLKITSVPSEPIPQTLFGMHLESPAEIPWPAVPFGTWRIWDSFVGGEGTFWPHLERFKGQWNFKALDTCVELAQKKGVEVLYVMSLTPKWAAARPGDAGAFGDGPTISEPQNIEDWRNFVRTVATRYKGKIKYYELWNEPSLKNWYSGTVDKMVDLAREAYTILKQVDPSITVVSPSVFADYGGVEWLDKYLEKGGGNYADVIGAHFYIGFDATPEEESLLLIRKIQQVMAKHKLTTKPLWNTETGYGNKQSKQFYSDSDSMAFVARSYIVNWALGLKRFYWYGWDTANVVTLLMVKDDKKTLTPAAKAYEEIQKWLIGTRMESCDNSNGRWFCALTRRSGDKAWVVWNPKGELSFDVPKTWNVRQVKDLTGSQTAFPNDGNLKIGRSPILLSQ